MQENNPLVESRVRQTESSVNQNDVESKSAPNQNTIEIILAPKEVEAFAIHQRACIVNPGSDKGNIFSESE